MVHRIFLKRVGLTHSCNCTAIAVRDQLINQNALLLTSLLLGTVQCDWAGVWKQWMKNLAGAKSWMIEWYVVKCYGQKL